MGFYTNLGKGLWKTSQATARIGQRASANIADNWQGRSARRGLLGPGAGPPPPGQVGDFYDYRGVASGPETRALEQGEYPLGLSIRIGRRGRSAPLGVPFSLMRRHAIVIGPAGSGKTESLIIPWMYAALLAGHTVVATDVKGDLKERLKLYASAGGPAPRVPIKTWDSEAEPGGSASWNWISSLTNDARLDAAIVSLLGRQDQNPRPDLWNIDYEITKGLILYARTHFRRPICADDLRACLDQDEIDRSLRGSPRFPGYAELWPYVALSPGDFTKATSGIRPVLAALCTPNIRRVTEKPQLDLDHVLDTPGLVIIGARLSGGAVSEKLSALALGVFQQRLYERLGTQSHDRHVFVMVDEAGPLLERIDFARALTTVRSGGVSFVLGLQAAEMISDDGERGTILGNAAVTVALRGMSEKTADHLSKRFGSRTEQVVSDSTSMYGNERGRQVSHTQLPVLAPRELQWPPFGDYAAVVSLVGDSRVPAKPILVDLTRTDLL